MKQFKESTAAKFAAWVLATVSGVTLFASVCGAYLINENGFYTKSEAEIRADEFDAISRRYSALALQNPGNGVNEAYFADKNFKYGIIEAPSMEELEKMDLSADGTYVERNFTTPDAPEKLEDMTVFQCYVNDWTDIFADDSLFGYYYVSNSQVSTIKEKISQYVYNLDNGIYYYLLEDGQYFPIDKLEIVLKAPGLGVEDQHYFFEYHTDDESYHNITGQQETTTNINLYTEGNETGDYVTEEWTFEGNAPFRTVLQPYEEIEEEVYQKATDILNREKMTKVDFAKEEALTYQEAFIYNPSDAAAEDGWVKAEMQIMLPSVDHYLTEQIQNRTDYTYADAVSLNIVRGNVGTNYYVVSYVQDPLVKKEGVGIWGNDLYVQTEYFLELAEKLKYSIYVIAAVSLFLFAGSIVFLFASAGHKEGCDGITLGFVNRVPWEILTAVWGMIEIILFLILNEMSYAVRHQSVVFYGIGMCFVMVVFAWLVLAYLLDFVVRLKAESWWNRTLLYRAGKLCFTSVKTVGTNLNILWKGIALFFVFNFLQVALFVVFGVSYNTIMWIWLLEKALLLAGGVVILIQMQRLQDGSRHIADGDIEYKIQTEQMLPALKEHGENLNRINEGVSRAVNEKMKSERFKTELITNVSHDIKTPLTSIINYVDLLEKEEIDNEKAKEYLEVLERQSARLKKLIEDLIEASKASSGALSVNLEKLEAGVFLVQTVGEFEEKTEKNGLDLIIKKPEEAVYIMADGRHFWRVIDNLMNNICKYAQPQTRVYINLEQAAEKVRISFMNTSKYQLNISSEELMERFVRGDSSRNTEGNGLGLSIAGSLMELMKGKMTLHVDGDLFKVVLEFDRVES